MKTIILSIMFAASFTILIADGVHPVGSGTVDAPYQIETLENLLWLDTTPAVLCAYFIQTADIDASSTSGWNDGEGFLPIGNSDTLFRGDYDGQNYVIDSLYINRGEDYVGLFGCIVYATIQNTHLTNIDITGIDRVGGIAGSVMSSTIRNCSCSGHVQGVSLVGGMAGCVDDHDIYFCNCNDIFVTGVNSVGGLIGSILSGNVWYCSSSGIVEGDAINVGGLIGCNCAMLRYSWSSANVNSNYFSGGLIGRESGNNSIVTDCFASGNVSGTSSIGGLIGICIVNIPIIRCYSTGAVSGCNYVGGLIGNRGNGSITDCFWDIETSEQSTSDGGTGLSTDEMQDILTYLDAGWDFQDETENGEQDLWGINPEENGGYPFLSWQGYSHGVLNGEGTESAPYRIGKLRDLRWLSRNDALWASHIIQTYDIDASATIAWNDSTGFRPIGCDTLAFSGSYDGQDHSIDNLHVNRPEEDNQGLFGSASGAEISSLHLVDADIAGNRMAAGIVGCLGYESSLTDCSVSGVVSGMENSGGIVGVNRNTSVVSGCTNFATVSGSNRIGGVVGANYNYAELVNCWNEGTVNGSDRIGGVTGYNNAHSVVLTSVNSGSVSGGANVGGLVGKSTTENSYIEDSFNMGDVSGVNMSGGLVGNNTNLASVECCYSVGTVSESTGGLLGYNDADVDRCFWDIEASGQSSSAAGTGLTTEEMRSLETYGDVGWDFAHTWVMDAAFNNGYPFLIWQTLTPSPIKPQSIMIGITDGTVHLSWDDCPYSDAYVLYGSNDLSSGWSVLEERIEATTWSCDATEIQRFYRVTSVIDEVRMGE